MNLEKKFREVLEQNAEPQNGDYYLSGTIIEGQFNDLSKQCVQICDDFAVGFLDFIYKFFYRCENSMYHPNTAEKFEGKYYNVTELLEIYKQGL